MAKQHNYKTSSEAHKPRPSYARSNGFGNIGNKGNMNAIDRITLSIDKRTLEPYAMHREN